MTREINIFQKLLEKYKIGTNIPDAARNSVISSMKANLKSVLKKVDNYSLVFGKTLSVYYFFRKSGFQVSITQAKILLSVLTFTILTFTMVMAIGIGSYLAKTFISNERERTEILKIEKNKVASVKPIPDKIKTKEQIIKPKSALKKKIPTRLGIMSLVASGVDRELVTEISNKFYRSIRSYKGKDRVLFGKASQRKHNVNRKLLGRVSKLGSKLILNIRVINAGNGKILFTRTNVIKDKKNIDREIQNISLSISNSNKIWNHTPIPPAGGNRN